MKSYISRAKDFFEKDIWSFRVADIVGIRSLGIKLLRVIVLAIKDFFRDQCQIRASALTFYSVLSVVPVVAMLFAVSKGFGLQTVLKDSLLQKFGEEQQQQIVNQIFDYAENMLNNAKGGVIAGIGVFILLYSVIKLFSNIEVSFNHIWRVKNNRPFWLKLRDYLIIVVLAAVAIVFSSSLTVFISTHLKSIAEQYEVIGAVSAPFVFVVIKLLPFVVMWIFFSILYKFMPNTKVTYGSAFVAGVIVGTVFQLIQVFFIYIQVMVSRSSAIYGSLSALPLFFLWTQITWTLVLFGAELAFAHQNSDNFEFEIYTDKISNNAFRTYMVKTAAFLVQNFFKGNPPCGIDEISKACRMSIGLSRKIIYTLIDANVVCESINHDDNDSIVYQPACNAGEVTIFELFRTIDEKGMDGIEPEDDDYKRISGQIKGMTSPVKSSKANIKLRDIKLSKGMFS